MNSLPDDTRNVMDEFKGMPEDQIVQLLDARGARFEIALENTLRDYNMGSIIRTANAFGVRKVHIVGRRQWNKRGAMMTDKYLEVIYHASFDELRSLSDSTGYEIVAVDNVEGAESLATFNKQPHSILLFGQEGPGLSERAIAAADKTVMIEQRGSTRSLNVAAAAAIVMYEWSNIA